MWTARFWKSTIERAIKTAAQAAIALLTADGILSIVDVDFGQGAGVVALATVVSLLTSLVSSGFGDSESPSLVGESE